MNLTVQKTNKIQATRKFLAKIVATWLERSTPSALHSWMLRRSNDEFSLMQIQDNALGSCFASWASCLVPSHIDCERNFSTNFHYSDTVQQSWIKNYWHINVKNPAKKPVCDTPTQWAKGVKCSHIFGFVAWTRQRYISWKNTSNKKYSPSNYLQLI